jgi:hypothetical protein
VGNVAAQESSSTDRQGVTYAIYSWAFKEDAPIEDIERAFDEMCAMGDPIPGVRRATWGRNTADDRHARGHTHAMIVIADSPEAVGTYNNRTSKHPMADTLHGAEQTGVGILFTRPA